MAIGMAARDWLAREARAREAVERRQRLYYHLLVRSGALQALEDAVAEVHARTLWRIDFRRDLPRGRVTLATRAGASQRFLRLEVDVEAGSRLRAEFREHRPGEAADRVAERWFASAAFDGDAARACVGFLLGHGAPHADASHRAWILSGLALLGALLWWSLHAPVGK